MSKILANEIANFGDNAPIELKEGLNIPAGKPLQAAGVSGSPGQVLSSTGTTTFWITPFNGDYNNLSNKPSIPAAQIQSDWTASGGSIAAILNKPVIPPQPSVTSADASGSGTLSYNQSNGQFTFTPPDLSNYDIAYGWGDHAQAGYLLSAVETLDTVCERGKSLSSGQYIVSTDVRIVGTDGIKASFFGSGGLGGNSQGDLTMRHNDSTSDSFISHGNTLGDLTISSVTRTILTAGSPSVTVLTAQNDGIIIDLGLTVNGNIALGTGDLTTTGKIYYSNNFSDLTALNSVSAATYHGMFAHVHAENHGYFSHAGAWIQILDTGSSIGELADVDLTTSPTANDVLTWDGSNWAPAAPTGGGGGGGATSSDLQGVTDNGSSTTNSITVGGLQVNGSGLAETFKLNTNTVSTDYSSVSGTIGDIKRINEYPHYYDGTTWRPFYLSGTPAPASTSDVHFDDVQVRITFDDGVPYNHVNKRNLLITNVNVSNTPARVNVATSPSKFGTHSMKCFTEGGTARGEGFTYGSLENSAYSSWWNTPSATDLAEPQNWSNAKRGGSVDWAQDWTLEFWIRFEDLDQIGSDYTSNWPSRGIFHTYYNLNEALGAFGLVLHTDNGTAWYLKWINEWNGERTEIPLEIGANENYEQRTWYFISLTFDASSGDFTVHRDGVNTTHPAGPYDYSIPSANVSNFVTHFGTFKSDPTSKEYLSKTFFDDLRITQYARYGSADYAPPTEALPITADAPPIVDPDWSNVIIRSTFDVDFDDIGPNPSDEIAINYDVEILSTNIKYGTGALRIADRSSYLRYYNTNSPLDISGTWTIEFWLDVTSVGALNINTINQLFACIWSQTDNALSTNDDYAFGLQHTSQDYVYGGVAYNGLKFYWRNFDSVYTLHSDEIPTVKLFNQYNHIAIVRGTGGDITVFFNGYKLRSNASDTSVFTDTNVTYQTSSGFRIGRPKDPSGNESGFEGYVDDFRITTTVKYTDNFTPPSAPLPTTGTASNNPPGTATSGYLTYPTGNGDSGQVLTSDGTGNVNWDDVSYTETDPVFSAHIASDILQTNINNWNDAYGWGDHGAVGYLTTEADTLETVTGRGGTTSSNLTLGGTVQFNNNCAFGSNKVLNFGPTSNGRILYVSATNSFDVRVPGGAEDLKLGAGTAVRITNENGLTDRAVFTSSGLDLISGDFTTTGKLYYSNNFADITALNAVSPTTYHGMFAHVHAEGHGYFAHAGAWTQLLDTGSNLSELADVATTAPSTNDVLAWDGSNWTPSASAGGGGGANVTISDTAPGSASAGDLWWESDKGRLKIYYNDTDSTQWVDASPPLTNVNVPVAVGYIFLNGTSPTWTGTSGYTVSGTQPGGAGTDYVITLTFPTAYSARTDYIVQATYDSTGFVSGNGASIGVVRGTSSVVFTPRRWNEDPLSLGEIMITITNL